MLRIDCKSAKYVLEKDVENIELQKEYLDKLKKNLTKVENTKNWNQI